MTRLRGIVWAAVSTTIQANEDEKYSIPSQIADGQAFLAAQNIDLIDTLVVPGHSRNYKSLDRLASDARAKGIDAFDKLAEHLEACDFDVIWCRDANRFARKASLMHYIVESVVEDCGARIYSQNDGWVDATNADMFAMVKGYTTAKERKGFAEAGLRGRTKLAERGLPTGSQIPMTHRLVRDPQSGRALELVLAEDMLPVWRDLATLFLAGTAWLDMGWALTREYGHTTPDGEPFNHATLYNLMHNPLMWGNTAISPKYANRPKGAWVFDPSEPAPPGVRVFYGTAPAVYTGELAEAMQAEMRRRMAITGNASPSRGYRYSGLFVCEECGYTMAVLVKRTKREGLRCLTHQREWARKSTCSQRWIGHGTIDAFMQAFLEELLRAEDLTDTLPPPDAGLVAHMEQLTHEAANLNRQIDTLIVEQSLADAAIQPHYRNRANRLAEQLTRVEAAITATQASLKEQSVTPSQRRTFADLQAMGLEAFWQQSDTKINQMLRKLMGSYRFMVRDKEVVDRQRR